MRPKEKTINGYPFVAYSRTTFPPAKMIELSGDFYRSMNERRTVRDFSDEAIPKEVIENLLMAASTAPSGVHRQPWTFCVVSNAETKKQIRVEAEREEQQSYSGRMSEKWLDDLRPLQTNWQKPFLETAPYLIVVFKKSYDILPDGTKQNNYYVNESVGIACGFLLAAIHHAGLVALTHTPSPMNFLSKILNRPDNERPYLLIPIGYPLEEMYVPKLSRKPLGMISSWYV